MSETTLIEAINKEAFELVGLISEIEKTQSTEEPKRLLKGTRAERDMVDMSDRIDGTGIAVGINQSEKPSTISLETKEKSYGLHSKHFIRYQSFVKKIVTAKQFKDLASEGFISNIAFRWIMDVYINKKPGSLLSEYLSAEVKASIKPYRFYFPVLNLEIEESFKLGNVEFMYFTRQDMNELYENYLAMPIVRKKTMTEEDFKNIFRVQYQGRVLVKVEVTAEHDKAEEIAKKHASMAVDILKLFWATVMVPEQRTMFDLDYRLNYQVKTNYISEEVNKKNDHCLGVKFNNPYSDLTPEHLAFVLHNGLNEFSNFITLKKEDELYSLIIQAINFMAITLSTWDLHLRCISIITTLESLLLKDEEKAKARVVKQRLVQIVANGEPDINIVNEAFTHVYNVRHDMVHKAKRTEINIQKLSQAQLIMVLLLRRLMDININGKILNKADFIGGII